MLGNLTLTLCLTHQCNLRCRYCYAGRKYDVAMPSSTLERAIDIALAEVQTGAFEGGRTHRDSSIIFLRD